MDLRRVRKWEWASAVSAAVLIVAMFLPWYSSEARGVSPPLTGSANAWQAFTVVDLFVLLAALAGIALFVAAATQRTASVPQTIASMSVPPAAVAVLLVLLRTIDLPGRDSVPLGSGTTGVYFTSLAQVSVDVTRDVGLWLGLAASAALLLSIWRSMSDQRFPREVAPKIDITPLPAPRPEGQPR